METKINEGTWQHSDYEKLDLLVGRFFRILRACGVNDDELTVSLRKILQNQLDVAATRGIHAPADLHLTSTDLVFCWRRSPPFIDAQGRPKKLRLSGTNDSFDELVRQTAPNVSPSLLFNYLEQLGIVRRDKEGFVVLLADSVLACSSGEHRMIATSTVLTHIQAFLSAVEYNLLDRCASKSPRFERACYGRIPSELVPILERLIEVRGQDFIDSIDEWLDRHRAVEDDGRSVWLAGAGAYVFSHPSNFFEK